MPKPVQLSNGRFWRTQGEALAHFKQMLARYANGERVVNEEDHADLAALLTGYDAAIDDGSPAKAGSGIDYFTRQSNAGIGWSTDGFWVHCTDGTSIDFSYINAVKSHTKKD